MDLESLIQSLTKFSVSYADIFSYKDWKLLNCTPMWKVTLVFSSTILKYWCDLFSLEILNNVRITSPTHALRGWYIYRHSTLVVFRAGLYRQPFLKFPRTRNYRELLSIFLLPVPVRETLRFKKAESYFNSYWVGMVKYGCVLLGHRTLKSAIPQLKNKSMNWADFSHAGSDGIIFG